MATGDPISGLAGKAYYGATPTEIEITRWTFERTIGTIDVTDSGNASAGYRAKISNGFTEGSGTIEGFVKLGTALPAMGTELALKLSSTAARYWGGNGIITSISEALEVAGGQASTFQFNFEVSGAWTLTDP